MTTTCNLCGGPPLVLGRQGRTVWGRCRDCGWLVPLSEKDWQEFLRDDNEDEEGADMDEPPADN
jgi:hypothetical protein